MCSNRADNTICISTVFYRGPKLPQALEHFSILSCTTYLKTASEPQFQLCLPENFHNLHLLVFKAWGNILATFLISVEQCTPPGHKKLGIKNSKLANSIFCKDCKHFGRSSGEGSLKGQWPKMQTIVIWLHSLNTCSKWTFMAEAQLEAIFQLCVLTDEASVAIRQ